MATERKAVQTYNRVNEGALAVCESKLRGLQLLVPDISFQIYNLKGLGFEQELRLAQQPWLDLHCPFADPDSQLSIPR